MTIIATLRAEIAERQKKIDAIQNECSHPLAALTETMGSDTENYDRSNDTWWSDYHCGLCDKRWRVDRNA